MNKLTKFKPILFVVMASFLLSGCRNKPSQKLTIATAANVQFAMEELTELFTQETGIETEIVLGSSGKLLAQIKEGAPFDLFVSANMKYPEDLYKNGFAENEPKVYAWGKLVMWTMYEDIKPSISLLLSDSVKHIAIANAKTAPYGIAAEQLFSNLKIYDLLKDKLVYGESISQTNQFIISGAAEIGLTAMSVVMSPEVQGKGRWASLDDSLYMPIAQGAVVIKKKDHDTTKAEQFYAFLFSEKAQQVLAAYGYITHEQP